MFKLMNSLKFLTIDILILFWYNFVIIKYMNDAE